jgi:hypothetical protein
MLKISGNKTLVRRLLLGTVVFILFLIIFFNRLQEGNEPAPNFISSPEWQLINGNRINLNDYWNLTDPELFYQIGNSVKDSPISDKIWAHYYSDMYGTYFLPYVRRKHTQNQKIKLFEISIACDRTHGPGASVAIWKRLFQASKDEIWVAEYNRKCVENMIWKGKAYGIHPLIGDQSNPATLSAWIKDSGGEFDLIIDDGRHANKHIYRSFQALWPELVSGGVYFIEDLHVSRKEGYTDKTGSGIEPTMNYIYSWIEQFVGISDRNGIASNGKKNDRSLAVVKNKPAPPNIHSISCYFHACAIQKNNRFNGNVHSFLQKPSPDKNSSKAFSGFHARTSSLLWTQYYSDVYAHHLVPYVHRKHYFNEGKLKFLELGSSCAVRAVTVEKVWRTLFNEKDEIWEASYDTNDEKCNSDNVNNNLDKWTTGKESGFHSLMGSALQFWRQETGGDFDIIIDHIHQNHDSIGSFEAIWPEVLSGGIYIFQDLHLSRSGTGKSQTSESVIDYIYSWMEQLVISENEGNSIQNQNHRIPKSIHSISCYYRSCVIEKCSQFSSNRIQFCS